MKRWCLRSLTADKHGRGVLAGSCTASRVVPALLYSIVATAALIAIPTLAVAQSDEAAQHPTIPAEILQGCHPPSPTQIATRDGAALDVLSKSVNAMHGSEIGSNLLSYAINGKIHRIGKNDSSESFVFQGDQTGKRFEFRGQVSSRDHTHAWSSTVDTKGGRRRRAPTQTSQSSTFVVSASNLCSSLADSGGLRATSAPPGEAPGVPGRDDSPNHAPWIRSKQPGRRDVVHRCEYKHPTVCR